MPRHVYQRRHLCVSQTIVSSTIREPLPGIKSSDVKRNVVERRQLFKDSEFVVSRFWSGRFSSKSDACRRVAAAHEERNDARRVPPEAAGILMASDQSGEPPK